MSEDGYTQYKEMLQERYTKQREKLLDQKLEASGRYDKSLLTIACGAIVVSIALVEKLSFNHSVIILAIGWGFCILSISLQLIALLFGPKSIEKAVSDLDKEYQDYFDTEDLTCLREIVIKWNEKKEKLKNHFTEIIKYLNISTIIFLGLGIIFICIFSYLNIRRSEEMAENKGQNKRTTSGGRASGRTNATEKSERIPPPPKPAAPKEKK